MILCHYYFVDTFHVIFRVIHQENRNWKHKETKILEFQQSVNSGAELLHSGTEFQATRMLLLATKIGPWMGAFGRRIGSHEKNMSHEKNRAPPIWVRAPIWWMSGRVFTTLGTVLWAQGPILSSLYIEKCVSDLRVHEFWDLKHILEQRLCKSGGQPSKLIVNHPLHVWIFLLMLVSLYFSYE